MRDKVKVRRMDACELPLEYSAAFSKVMNNDAKAVCC